MQTYNGLVQQSEQEQEPDLRISQGFLDLVPLDRRVVNTCLILLRSRDKQSLFVAGKAFRGHDVVWEVDEQQDSPAHGYTTANDVDCSPHSEAFGVANAKEENAADRRTYAVEAVERACSGGLLSTGVELANDHHKGRSDQGFANTQEEPCDRQSGEIGACGR